jgi:translocation and assembly module TamA
MGRLKPGKERTAMADNLVASDPRGPIPKPKIPAALSARDLGFHSDRRARGERILYHAVTVSPDLPEAKELFEKTAEIYTMGDKPLYSQLALTRRLKDSVSTGEEVLKSLGYYDGKVFSQTIKNEKSANTLITVTLNPGALYTVGDFSLRSSGPPEDPEKIAPLPSVLKPDLLELKKGDPAEASLVLRAVSDIPDRLGSVGYPFAEITATRYFLEPDKKLLDAELMVYAGDFVNMGDLIIEGDNPVKERYLRNLINWKIGQPWDQEAINAYKDELFARGLFKDVSVKIGNEDPETKLRPVVLHLERAPLRTVTGSLNYDSDFGPGAEISWEHRNLTGWGDDFRADLPYWKDLRQLGVQYQRPFFFSKRQSLLSKMSLLEESADSYELESLSAQAGLERILSRHLIGKLGVSLEKGSLDEFILGKKRYNIWGFPASLEWNWANSLLDPTKGHRLLVYLAPYAGHYFDNFTILKARVDAYQYFDLKKDESLILAIRLSAGGIAGAVSKTLPASLRFFAGGGGSVRGYRYQSIGPRNDRDKPAGGNFLTELSSEIRYHLSKSIGIVAFLDGGNLYDELDPQKLGKDLLWGGGLGLRYYTSIGPFRLDLATPLNPREGDSRLQIYLSLGQSF